MAKSSLSVKLRQMPPANGLAQSPTVMHSFAILQQIGVVGSPFEHEVIDQLTRGSIVISDIELQLVGKNADLLLRFHALLQALARFDLIDLETSGTDPIAKLRLSPNAVLTYPASDCRVRYRLSRFAVIHLEETGELIAETPRASCRLVFFRPEAGLVLYSLARGMAVSDLSLLCPNLRESELLAFIELLLACSLVEPCLDDGTIAEDHDDTLRQWEFHDLLFHARSRMGRTNGPIGGNFRFLGKLEPQPAICPHSGKHAPIVLYQPDIEALSLSDPPLTAVIEARRSVREQGTCPISTQQLGEFLYRVGRIRRSFRNDFGEFTNRPYPSGGASYETEIYVVVNSCIGIDRGFYYFDPVAHGLTLMSYPNDDMEAMLCEAWLSSAKTCFPQVLLVLASRFQRVSWKYQGMAYATQLKNVGVLYAYMYLVATAMHLGPCAIGLGNPDRFCRLAGTDYYKEGSVGEFMLGSNSTG